MVWCCAKFTRLKNTVIRCVIERQTLLNDMCT